MPSQTAGGPSELLAGLKGRRVSIPGNVSPFETGLSPILLAQAYAMGDEELDLGAHFLL